jgi:SAM-dependent methyltransferase
VKLGPRDLERIERLTLDHYDQRADTFWEGTRDHDVSQNISALLEHIEGKPPFRILDLGCGPGRDLKAFSDLGHIAIGVEGVRELCANGQSVQRLRSVAAGFSRTRVAEK